LQRREGLCDHVRFSRNARAQPRRARTAGFANFSKRLRREE